MFNAIEVDLFIEAIKRLTGHDFSQYSRASVHRLLQKLMHLEKESSLTMLIPKMIDSPEFCEKVINQITVSSSALFRDPKLFQHITQDVLSYLRSFPKLSIWIAGCANGEEAYSLAISLHEAGLLGRTNLYATDISTDALSQAKLGILYYGITDDDQHRYRESGGLYDLTDYFHSGANGSIFKKELLSRIHFERHDFLQQPSFTSANFILCRNVFIYFDRELKDKAINRLLQSLLPNGYFAAGIKEDINGCESMKHLALVSREAGLYRAIA